MPKIIMKNSHSDKMSIKQAKLRLTITSRVKILKRSTFSIDVLLLYTPHNHLVQAHIQINWTFAEMEI